MQESKNIEMKNAEHIKRIVSKLQNYSEQIGNGFDSYIHSKPLSTYYMQIHRITLWKGLYDYLKLETEKIYDVEHNSKILDELEDSLNIVLNFVYTPEKIDNSTMFHINNVYEICLEINTVDLLEEFPDEIKINM